MPRLSDYAFGRVILDGEAHTRDLVVTSGEVLSPWVRQEGHRLVSEDLAWVLDRAPRVLVVGTGAVGRLVVPEDTIHYVAARGIVLVARRTARAIDEFNALEGRGEQVAACLHLTC
jgi:hypothetical protein